MLHNRVAIGSGAPFANIYPLMTTAAVLFVRCFQYGTFCPIFRVHGTRATDQNELDANGLPSRHRYSTAISV